MASNTPNLGLYKKDPLTDGNNYFDVKTMMNDNWDIIDTEVGNLEQTVTSHLADYANPHVVTADQVGAVKKTGDSMTGNLVVTGTTRVIDLKTSLPSGGWVPISIRKADGTEAWRISVTDQTANNLDLINVLGVGELRSNGFAVYHAGNTGKFFVGTGSPEGVVTAPIGALYQRSDGGASTTLYVKQSGVGNTGWVAK